MKKIVLLFVAVFFVGLGLNAQTTPAATPVATEAPAEAPSNAIMTFEDGSLNYTLDYGTIQQNAEPLRVVKFTNTGTEPLVIKNAKGSCGCTVPEWPKEPILPGESSQIEIRYATNRVGKFNKKVTITTNEATTHTIDVMGNVLQAEEEKNVPESAPSVIKSGGN